MTDTARLSPRQRRALHVMEIDLYVARGAPAQLATKETSPVAREDASPVAREDASPVARGATSPSAAVAASSRAVARSAAVAGGEQSAAVALDCLASAGVVVIGAFVDAADARFAQDVLAALVGGDAAVQRSAFKWPQTQTGDRSRAAAERAYAGFLNGQTERAGAGLLLLLGAAATMLLPDHRADAGYAVVAAPAIGDLRRDPARKKALWSSIRRFANR